MKGVKDDLQRQGIGISTEVVAADLGREQPHRGSYGSLQSRECPSHAPEAPELPAQPP